METIPLVWVIDDDEVFSFGFPKMLVSRKIAARVEVFKEAGAALEALETQLGFGYPLPKAIFLDLYMPGVDGWGFIERFQQLATNELFGKIAVFLLTSSIDESDKARALRSNAITCFIPKPVVPSALEDLLSNYPLR